MTPDPVEFVRIRSWHIRAGVEWPQAEVVITLCGRITRLGAMDRAVELPLDEPSCETCFRIARHRAEREVAR